MHPNGGTIAWLWDLKFSLPSVWRMRSITSVFCLLCCFWMIYKTKWDFYCQIESKQLSATLNILLDTNLMIWREIYRNIGSVFILKQLHTQASFNSTRIQWKLIAYFQHDKTHGPLENFIKGIYLHVAKIFYAICTILLSW